MQASRPPSPLINVRGYGGQPSPESERRLVRKRGFRRVSVGRCRL